MRTHWRCCRSSCWSGAESGGRSTTHFSQRQISRQVGISLMTVNRIIKNDLQLKCHKKRRAHELTDGNKKKRFDCCRKLLRWYPVGMENFIWFTDKKLFTVAAPSNTQNDRVYAPVGVEKKNTAPSCLLHCRPTFSSSLMVSVGVSALGRTDLHFIDAGVKINGQYYREVLLMQKFLPTSISFRITSPLNKIWHLLTAQRRRSICSSAKHQTSSRRHFGLQIVQTSTQSITRHGAFFSSGFTARKFKMWTSCDSASLRNGNAWTSAWSTTQTVASTSLLLNGCEGRTFRANVIMCQSDSIYSTAWQL